MSLFPVHLKPGGTLTVHLRLQVFQPLWVHRKDYLIDPHGKKSLVYERLLPFTSPGGSFSSEEDEQAIAASGLVVAGAPLLMAARYLHADTKTSSTRHFLDVLQGLVSSTHHYYTLTVPEDAPLGRYHFELNDHINGEVWKSGTADADYFFVEQLEVVEKGRHPDGSFEAHIRNPSPEPVAAQLWQFDTEATTREDEFVGTTIVFPPQSVSRVSTVNGGILMYRQGDEHLRIGADDDPLVLGNPELPFLRSPECTTVFNSNGKGVELTGDATEIWRMAHGFAVRSAIRTPEKAEMYDEMVRLGLLKEVY